MQSSMSCKTHANKKQEQVMSEEILDPIVISEQQFDRAAARIVDLKSGLIDYLKEPNRIHIINCPVEMDDGSVKTIECYRVIQIFGSMRYQVPGLLFVTLVNPVLKS